MSNIELDKKKIESLLPHREPMLLIDKLTKIVPLKSATAIMYVKKNGFYVQGHFPNQPVMPGVLIVEAFGQAAAALTAHGIDPKEYANKLVYLMGVDKARFRSPVIPDCELHLEIEAVRSHGRVWKYKGTAKVNGKETPIYNLNYVLRGIPVAPGVSEIEFEFTPLIIAKGTTIRWITVILFLFSILTFGYFQFRKRKIL